MRIKICGITNKIDAQAAVEAGADAIGLNLVGGPRKIAPESAADIIAQLPPWISPIVLISLNNGQIDPKLNSWLNLLRVRYVQLYGHYAAEDVRRLMEENFVPIPVVSVRDENFVKNASHWLCRGLKAVLLDTFDPQEAGGTGKSFDWQWIQQARQEGTLQNWPDIILAGGLRPDNVADAVRTVQPYAVDVSSGVEIEGQPGRKDPEKMRAFVQAARQALAS